MTLFVAKAKGSRSRQSPWHGGLWLIWRRLGGSIEPATGSLPRIAVQRLNSYHPVRLALRHNAHLAAKFISLCALCPWKCISLQAHERCKSCFYWSSPEKRSRVRTDGGSSPTKKRTWGTLTGSWIPLEQRNQVVQFITYWTERAKFRFKKMLTRINLVSELMPGILKPLHFWGWGASGSFLERIVPLD